MKSLVFLSSVILILQTASAQTDSVNRAQLIDYGVIFTVYDSNNVRHREIWQVKSDNLNQIDSLNLNVFYFSLVDELAVFDWGKSDMEDFIDARMQSQFVYNYLDQVVVLIIDQQGNCIQYGLLNSQGILRDNEMARIIRLFPKWKPGIKNGKPVISSRRIRF